jgi:hypothetical protein
MIPFRYQLLGHLVIALLLSLLLNVALQPTGGAPDIGRKATPFTTQADMLAVTVAVYPEAPPQILDVQPLETGRLSVTQPGPYALTLEAEDEEALYRLSFRATFVMPGLRQELDEARPVFVLPAVGEAVRLVLSGPPGEAVYPLTE